MTRENTNKHYSLRKLKKGTASVAVALSILGAGLASQTEVKANGEARDVTAELPAEMWKTKYTNELKKSTELGEAYKAQEETLLGILRDHSNLFKEKQKELNDISSQLEFKNAQIAKLVNDNDSLKEAIEGYVDTIQQASREVSAKQEELAAAQLQLEAKNAEIENLKLQDNMKAEEIAKLESEAKILENLIGSGKRELGDLEAKLADANAQKAKLESEAVILENLIGSGKREIADLQAKLDAANADNAKLIEEKQILEASRKRTNRDLEAARNAKKEVDAELAKLKAEAEALKEQLAKQAQEIEKLKDSKEASPKAPEAPKTPEKPEVTPKDSGKSTMPWTALTPAKPIAKANMSSTDAKKDSHQLPSTGEAATPFFTAAAMSVMASAGVLALKRKEEN